MYPKKYPFNHKVLVKLYQKNIPFTTKYFISFKPILCILNVLAFQTSLISKHVFIIRVFSTKKGYTTSLPIIMSFHFGTSYIRKTVIKFLRISSSSLGFDFKHRWTFSECAAALFVIQVTREKSFCYIICFRSSQIHIPKHVFKLLGGRSLLFKTAEYI